MQNCDQSKDRPLWYLSEIAEVISCSSSWPCQVSIEGVAFDSRQVKPGDIFFALSGGQEYIEHAFEKGALAAISDKLTKPPDAAFMKPTLLVPNALEALQQLGMAARTRAQNTTVFIGVTGSVGKTTTKETIAALLSNCKGSVSVFKTPGNFNNHIGLPLSLANMPLETTHAVYELGMDGAGQLKELTSWLRPHIAIITTVGMAHMKAFKCINEIALAKAEIFGGLDLNGVAIIPRDNEYFKTLMTECRDRYKVGKVLTFGRHRDSDVKLTESRNEGNGISFQIQIGCKKFDGLFSGSYQHESVENITGAVAVLDSLGMADDLDSILQKSMPALQSPKGRGNTFVTAVDDVGMVRFIDGSYNACPLSMRAALSGLQLAPSPILDLPGRKVAIIGDMLELGDPSKKAHEDLSKVCEDNGIDKVITVGPLMKEYLWPLLPKTRQQESFANVSELKMADLTKILQNNDTVLVKASNGVKLTFWLSNFYNHTQESL